jgi:hypothetical protein
MNEVRWEIIISNKVFKNNFNSMINGVVFDKSIIDK